MALYLGLDSSTQSLTAVIIEVTGSKRDVVFESSLRFDEDFPEYGTRNGILPQDDVLVAHSSPVLWAAALDRMMGHLRTEGVPIDDLRAIAGSGQQHGSVYLGAEAFETLGRLDATKPLASQIGGIFSRATSPIWMDSSTRSQCQEITDTVGGSEILAQLTGSQAFERFTGPQIRKFSQENPEAYAATRRIHLVSSYMASLLAGVDASIDPGDASGMNLMNIRAKEWSPEACGATAPDIAAKLPKIREAWHVNGTISPYFVERHGYSETVRIVNWSGDNPCSLIGVGLVEAGRLAISLGTSDTLFGFMPEPRVDPAGEGHTFGSPTGDYMSLLCFKNGSLAREKIREAYNMNWDDFSEAIRSTPPGNGAAILLPWFEPEITPNVLEPGPRRYALDPKNVAANVRAVVEAQMISMSLHSRWMGVSPKTIYATGGAAGNREILQVMADVHNADVYQFPVGNSAALGAALRAYHADRVADEAEENWTEVIREFAEPVDESRIRPDLDRVRLYTELKKVYEACEAHALSSGEDPQPLIDRFRQLNS